MLFRSINFKNFVVERSFDGAQFTKIATVNYNYNLSNYEYFDNALANVTGKIFYRLILVDNNGSFDYSEIRILTATQKKDVIVYPNPFQNAIEISLNVSKAEEKIELALYTSDGKLIMSKINNLKRGNNNIQLNDFGNLTLGVYILKIIREDGITTQKLIKN